MNVKELRQLGKAELETKLAEKRRELVDMRFSHATSTFEKTSSLPLARKDIARLLTILKEKE